MGINQIVNLTRTHLKRRLIASWLPDTEQTEAQNDCELYEN